MGSYAIFAGAMGSLRAGLLDILQAEFRVWMGFGFRVWEIWGYVGVILALYSRVILGFYWGYIGVRLGFY